MYTHHRSVQVSLHATAYIAGNRHLDLFTRKGSPRPKGVMELSTDPDVVLDELDSEHRSLCSEYSSLNGRFRALLQRPTNLEAQYAALEKEYETLVQKFHALNRKYLAVNTFPSDEREHAYSECYDEEEVLLEQYRELIRH